MEEPTEKQILNREYEFWQEAGMPDGRDDEFWFRAEKELSQATTPAEKSETISNDFVADRLSKAVESRLPFFDAAFAFRNVAVLALGAELNLFLAETQVRPRCQRHI